MARVGLGALTVVALGLGSSSAVGASTPTPTGDGGHSATGIPSDNFWLADAQGAVWNFGDAGALGSAASLPLNHPIVTITATKAHKGYWLVASDGGVFSYGDASFYGSTGAIALNRPIVGMAATPDGKGYWLVASDGGIFSFGDATFFGSTGSIALNEPIVGMAPTPDGKGYWLVASDGGIFNFGDAAFYGSTGAIHLDQPIVGMAPTPDGKGYWLVASDGGIFNFGDAAFDGSAAGGPALDPAERVVASPSGEGYWVEDQNGTAYPFGDAEGSPPTEALMFAPVTAGDRAVLFAFAQLGKPYIWGGNGPVGYDCSGLALASWENAERHRLRARLGRPVRDGGPAGRAELAVGRRPRVLGHQPDRLDQRVPHRHLRRRRPDRRGDGRPGAAELTRPMGLGRSHAQRAPPVGATRAGVGRGVRH